MNQTPNIKEILDSAYISVLSYWKELLIDRELLYTHPIKTLLIEYKILFIGISLLMLIIPLMYNLSNKNMNYGKEAAINTKNRIIRATFMLTPVIAAFFTFMQRFCELLKRQYGFVLTEADKTIKIVTIVAHSTDTESVMVMTNKGYNIIANLCESFTENVDLLNILLKSTITIAAFTCLLTVVYLIIIIESIVIIIKSRKENIKEKSEDAS